MRHVATSAPGKILVAGEYAVLHGAPAICMAINRRARVTIRPSGHGTHCVSAPGYQQKEMRFESIAEVAEDLPLLAAVWEQFPGASQESLEIEIDTRSFFSGREKLGIGSSAAATVALAAAFGAISGQGPDDCKQAQAAHLAMQNGRGSGADVASSYYGGLIEFRMSASASARLSWPKELHYALLWSGRSCSTAAQLQKLVGTGSSDAGAALLTSAEDVAVAWHAGAAHMILVALRGYVDALRHYDDEYQLDIFSAGHATLAKQAAASGLIYKPCGAGGGDFGMAFSDDLETLQKFIVNAEGEGFVHSDLTIDPVGLIVEQDEQ